MPAETAEVKVVDMKRRGSGPQDLIKDPSASGVNFDESDFDIRQVRHADPHIDTDPGPGMDPDTDTD
jgi:hypothetical protein